MAPSATPPLGLLDLPADVLELILVAVADPWSLRSVSLTCRRMAAATAPASPLWRTLLAANVHANLAAGGGWSGRPAGETVRRLIAGPWLRHLMGLARNRYLLSRWQWSPRMRPTHAAAFAALDALLGERPLLAFHFGHDVMNPTGGVLAVQWSPSLVLGVLVPVIHT